MREEDIDKLLKDKINNDIKAPESLKNRISYEIKNMNENKDVKENKNIKESKKTKLRVIQSIAAVAVFSILGVTTYATVTKNPILEKLGLVKGSTTYEEVAKDINQDLSNEYANITLKRMASDNAYIIMEYSVNLKEKGIEEFGEIEQDTFSGYKININNAIKINDKEIDEAFDTTGYVNRISDTGYEIYQIINIANINSKELNIEIEEKNLQANYNQTPINKKVIINATKDENTNSFEKIESKIDNKTIKIESIQNTSFETFIKVSVDIDNIKKSDMDFYSKNNPNNISFTVLDNNGNYIPNCCYTKVSYIQDNLGNKLDILTSYDENNDISFDNAKAHLEYIITLGDIDANINNIKLVPYTFILLNERTNEEGDYYDNMKWYKLQDGNYSETSTLGGKLDVTRIETSEDKIKFYYDLSGCITGYEEKVVLRINDERLGFNVIYPTNTYTKKINAEENYAEFDRNIENVGIYSYNFETEEDYKLKDLSKIEFALLAETKIDLLGEGIKLAVPDQKESYLTIKKIEATKLNDEIYNINQNEMAVLYPVNNTIDTTADLGTVNNTINNTTNNIILDSSSTEIFNANDNKLAGIKIGMTENQVREILGEPQNCTYSENMLGTKMSTFAYENMTIMFEQENTGNYIVTGIYSEDKNKVGPRGIKIGDTKESVISKFYSNKNVEYNDEYTILYSNGERISGTIYIMDGEKTISYFNENMTLDVHLGEDEKVVMMSLTILE